MNSMGMSRAFIACMVCGAPMAFGQVLTFTEVSEESGIVAFNHNPFNQPHGHNLSGGAVGDYNNDGWQDLFVISDGLFRTFMTHCSKEFSSSTPSQLVHASI